MAKDNSSVHHHHSSSPRPLYDILGVSQDSDTPSITRAYRRLALQYHPDRHQGDPECTEKFKKIGEAYHILSDETQRRIYDRTGQLPSGEQTVTPAQRSVEVEDQLRDFFTQYRGSEEEKEDFIQQFHATNGNFKKMIFERLLFDNAFPEEEVERLYALGEKELGRATEGAAQSKNEKKINSTSLWASTTTPEMRKKYIRRLKKEKKEAEEALQELLQQEQQEEEDHQEQDNEDEDEEEEEEEWRGRKHSKKVDSSGKGKSGAVDRSTSMEKKKKKKNRGGGDDGVGHHSSSTTTSSSLGALQVMMRDRQRAQWESMVSQMEGKYVTNRKKNKEEEEGKRTRKEGERKRKRSANEM